MKNKPTRIGVYIALMLLIYATMVGCSSPGTSRETGKISGSTLEERVNTEQQTESAGTNYELAENKVQDQSCSDCQNSGRQSSGSFSSKVCPGDHRYTADRNRTSFISASAAAADKVTRSKYSYRLHHGFRSQTGKVSSPLHFFRMLTY